MNNISEFLIEEKNDKTVIVDMNNNSYSFKMPLLICRKNKYFFK